MVKMQRNGILSSRLLRIKRLDQKSDLFYFAGAIYCKLTNAWPRKIKREDFYASGNSVAIETPMPVRERISIVYWQYSVR